MSVLVGWNCPKTTNIGCYFEQHDEALTKILVVISKPDDGMFEWLRIYEKDGVVDDEKEWLYWAVYSPKEDSVKKFVLFEKWTEVKSTSTTRTHYNPHMKADFEAKKVHIEALVLQTIRLRRLTAKAKHQAYAWSNGPALLSNSDKCTMTTLKF